LTILEIFEKVDSIRMTDYLKPRRFGDWQIDYIDFTTKDITIQKLRDAIHNRNELTGQKEGIIVRLLNHGSIVMTDTMMEKRTNTPFFMNVKGDILIAGLGLGIIITVVQDLSEVKSITIIEKSQEVIDLVVSQLPLNDKVKVIRADIFEWLPKPGTRYDTLYFDIWSAICGDYYDDMKLLRKRFSSRKRDKNSWLGHWREEDMRIAARRG